VKKGLFVAAVSVIVLILFNATLFALDNNYGQLLLADEPISYGEELFKQRIDEVSKQGREPVGLVLSGGSARAFAHIGVLKRLEEENIVPDFIISNSMGSIVGLLYAAGLSPDQILEAIGRVDITQLFDLTFPLQGGLLDISRFVSLFASYVGEDTNIEDLPIPIMIICEDLITKRQVRLMEGNALTVMGAAFALPVYFPPVQFRGHRLIDGGITNLVPVDTAYEYTDTTIVSTAFYEQDGMNLNNPLTILNVSIDIGKRRAGVKELLTHPSTIWIRSNVEEFSFMAFSEVNELTQRGYESASLHADILKELSFAPPSEALVELREEYDYKLEYLFADYELYQRGRIVGVSQQAYVGLKSYTNAGTSWFLRDEAIGGVAYQMRWHNLHFYVMGGGAWKTYTPMDFYPEITTHISYQIIPQLVIDGDVMVHASQGIFSPQLYSRVGLQFKERFASDTLTFNTKIWWEENFSFTSSEKDRLLHAGLELGYTKNLVDLQSSVGYQLSGNWNRHFLHTRVDSSFTPSKETYLHLGYTGRYALDAKAGVPLYWGDGFKTGSSALFENGGPGSSHSLVIGRFGFGFAPYAFEPTLGELLLIKDISFGAFSDLLFNNTHTFIPDFVVGGEATFSLSLLGLATMPAKVFVGYDSLSEGVVWGFMFGK